MNAIKLSWALLLHRVPKTFVCSTFNHLTQFCCKHKSCSIFRRNQKQIQNFVCKTSIAEESLKFSDDGVLLNWYIKSELLSTASCVQNAWSNTKAEINYLNSSLSNVLWRCKSVSNGPKLYESRVCTSEMHIPSEPIQNQTSDASIRLFWVTTLWSKYHQ